MRPDTPDRLLDRLCAVEPEGDAEAPPSVAIVVAHPDDEAVGASSLLPRLAPQGHVLYVTDGAPFKPGDARANGCPTREAYAARREAEAHDAMALAGFDFDRVVTLNIVDQQSSVQMAELAHRLAARFARLQPAAVLTHPYEGGHPDHDATALAVHAAVRLLQESDQSAPCVLEMTSYHMGPEGIRPFEFLDPDVTSVRTITLDGEAVGFKRRLLSCYATQHGMLRYFPLALERFRVAPQYDFLAAPHEGTLFYELFDWGMRGELWRELARDALELLGLIEGARTR